MTRRDPSLPWTPLLASVLALAAAPALRAQSTLGTIRGTLFDPQGRVVAQAAIRIVDESTGVSRTIETDSRGNFEAPNLRAGTYRAEDASPGFSVFERKGIVLRAGETVRVDLGVSAAMQELVVTAQGMAAQAVPIQGPEVVVKAGGGALIQLESPAIQGGLDAQQISSLPRGSREFQDFLYLNPNVVGSHDGRQFLGGRSYGIAYVHDGQPSSGSLFGTLTEASAGLDAIDEIKVLSNSYPAELGGVAAVVVTTRRGGNTLAGSSFYDFTNDPDLTEPETELFESRLHRWGGTLSGPLRKEKTFFLASYEGSRRAELRGGSTILVPTLAMRRGDFSAFETPLRDPRTGAPFAGNVIPADRIDPAALRILDFFYPLPNLPQDENGLGRNRELADVDTVFQRLDARIDHEFSPNDSAFVRASFKHRDYGRYFENSDFPRLGVRDNRFRDWTLATSWSRVVSGSTLNELRAGYNLEDDGDHSHLVAGELGDRLGIELPEGSNGRYGFPSFTFASGRLPNPESVPDVSDGADRSVRQSSLSIGDTLTHLHGRHSLRIGAFYSRDTVRDNAAAYNLVGTTGRFTFNGSYTGSAFGDFLLGLPANTAERVITRGLRPLELSSHAFGGFVQDDWKLNSRLTLFAGVRYEVIRPFVERNDLLVNFDPRSNRLVLPNERTVASLAPGAAAYPRVFARELGLGRAMARSDTNNLAPRVGFAHRLSGDNRAVLRGGFGFFHPKTPPERIADTRRASQAAREALARVAFRERDRLSAFNFSRGRIGPTLSKGFSSGSARGEDHRFSPRSSALDLQSPRIMQYHLTLERELPGDVGLRLSYLGARSDKLLMLRNINTLKASTTPFDFDNAEDRRRLPFHDLDPFVLSLENTGRGHMNALQVEARRRFRGGLGGSVAYTLTQSRTTAPDYGIESLGIGSLGIVQYDPHDLSKNEGPEPHLVRHRLVMDGSWELPFGRRRRYLGGMPSWLDAALGGWTVSTIVHARSGPYLTPCYSQAGFNPANTGAAPLLPSFECWRPDLVGDPDRPRSPGRFFNLAAFALPAPGTTGNAPSGIIEGPGVFSVNLGFHKTLARVRRLDVQLRLSIENVFDNPQYYEASGSPFVDLTEYLVGGRAFGDDNGETGVLRNLRSLEGFPLSRVMRLGVRVFF